MRTREEVLNILSTSLPELRRRGVREIGVFGSVAREQQNQESDIDILVDLEHHTFDSYMDVLFCLEDRFGCRIDLVMKESLKPAIKDTVLAETVYVETV